MIINTQLILSFTQNIVRACSMCVCRNKEWISVFLQMEHFCFPDLGKEKLRSILVFGNACFNVVVRKNHDNVASRGAVGRTRTIVRLQTRTRRKDGTENFGGFVYVLDGFLPREFLLWVFMSSINFSLFFCLFSGYHAEGYHAPPLSFTATTPRAPTPVQMHSS